MRAVRRLVAGAGMTVWWQCPSHCRPASDLPSVIVTAGARIAPSPQSCQAVPRRTIQLHRQRCRRQPCRATSIHTRNAGILMVDGSSFSYSYWSSLVHLFAFRRRWLLDENIAGPPAKPQLGTTYVRRSRSAPIESDTAAPWNTWGGSSSSEFRVRTKGLAFSLYILVYY